MSVVKPRYRLKSLTTYHPWKPAVNPITRPLCAEHIPVISGKIRTPGPGRAPPPPGKPEQLASYGEVFLLSVSFPSSLFPPLPPVTSRKDTHRSRCSHLSYFSLSLYQKLRFPGGLSSPKINDNM